MLKCQQLLGILTFMSRKKISCSAELSMKFSNNLRARPSDLGLVAYDGTEAYQPVVKDLLCLLVSSYFWPKKYEELLHKKM